MNQVVPGLARKGRPIDPPTMGHVGQGESRRRSDLLDLFHERERTPAAIRTLPTLVGWLRSN